MPHPTQEDESGPANGSGKVDTVLFDYGMVLSGAPDPVAWSRMCSVTALPPDRLHTAYWKLRHDYDRGALKGAAYWHGVAALAGVELTNPQITTLLDADVDLWTVPNQPMIDWAGRLQCSRVRTGILSNIGDCIAEGIIDRLRWLGGFDHCAWSHALSMAKPEPAIFLHTAQALHAAPPRILFIDDKIENVKAALAVGMEAIQYTTHPEFLREMQRRGLSRLLDAETTRKAK